MEAHGTVPVDSLGAGIAGPARFCASIKSLCRVAAIARISLGVGMFGLVSIHSRKAAVMMSISYGSSTNLKPRKMFLAVSGSLP